jgi:hypothetical protein
MTSRGLAMSLRFFLSSTLRHSSLQASSRHRPTPRDRRGSLLGHSTVNNPG